MLVVTLYASTVSSFCAATAPQASTTANPTGTTHRLRRHPHTPTPTNTSTPRYKCGSRVNTHNVNTTIGTHAGSRSSHISTAIRTAVSEIASDSVSNVASHTVVRGASPSSSTIAINPVRTRQSLSVDAMATASTTNASPPMIAWTIVAARPSAMEYSSGT